VVLVQTLERAGTCVCEPVLRLSIDSPSKSIRGLLNAIARFNGQVEQILVRDGFSTVEATMPADRSLDLQRQLSGLTGGEGNLESTFDGYQRVRGKPPKRSANSERSRQS
jgi:ribosomal protection tetracycline resistance protein